MPDKKLPLIGEVIRDPDGVRAAGERFQTCATCGQIYDTADAGQTFHHLAEGPHEPLAD